ncbi:MULTISPECIES: styrene monooxygenase/indole monooxygenase family protein [unclassified Streptomyces]|uniref:styrene monooxygenase/indole monooxygenase family protein n=1 Tax=unclassified Streptomyces TaxID=2593676 RepID=UPI00081E878A|nr:MULTISPECIES: styrene monooxygenase/indole monooxygenase family protein [unclassified Streptomyces]MYZ36178.1 FAD-binding oxidoreductase [Streptomyces sp. SID4917]SCF81529.1 2-polyprenyl-6-methoxyphenol hydroxylase [Streptomyces sp. MnatMP-M17]
MRKILVVGAGQSGLQLALGLQSRGYEITLMSNRTADEIRSGRVMSTQCMFHTALQHERDLQLGFWESQAPRIEGLGVSVTGPDSTRAVDWVGTLDGYAQSVDQRVKMAGWMETFAQRGGQLVIHGAAVSDLDYFSRTYDLVLVSAGKGELVSMFGRDASRSPYDTPQRALAVAYVHGLGPRPEHPDYDAVRCNLVPGVGELFVMPTLTTSGRADILFWEGVPGGPLDVFRGIKDPAEHLSLTLELMERFTPWEYARATKVELTDANATLAGRYAPTVRHPVGRLPGGGLALGVADVVVANDPITGQGSNSASKCAASYLESIVAHGDRPFDEAWMQTAFDRYWETARHVTKWTNAMLGVPPEHVLNLIGAAGGLPPVADRFANGFNDPADFENFFYEPEKTNAYLAEVSGAVGAGA